MLPLVDRKGKGKKVSKILKETGGFAGQRVQRKQNFEKRRKEAEKLQKTVKHKER